MTTRLLNALVFSLVLLQFGCSTTQLPTGIKPVSDFDLNRYLGTWYEIARLDHRFERGLEQVSATYTLQDDGTVAVLNRGYSPEKKSWKEANGKAKFVASKDSAHLKVSFFGPFYGSYVVFELDRDYQYALVTGPNRRYLWMLARTPDIDEALYTKLLGSIEKNGFDSTRLIRVQH